MRLPVLLIVILLALAACGKKGNLYLPDTPPAPASASQGK